MLMIDSHLDMGLNAVDWDRDLNLEVAEIRARERGMKEKGRACNTVSLPELRRAQAAVCLYTVLCRTARPGNPLPGVAHQEIAYARAQGHLAYYRVLEAAGKVRMLRDWASLKRHWDAWEAGQPDEPLGYILAMEGADPVAWPEQVAEWWADGLRVIGPAHYGLGIYAHGTSTPGGLTAAGRQLVREMDRVGMILDLSHLADEAFWEAMELYSGPVLASHNNCRALVPGDRQMSDEQLKAIFTRGGVVGVALDAWMLYPGWIKGETQPSVVGMEAVADHLDHLCQVAGNAEHAAIGSDLDGGYGTEQTPRDLDTITDLQKVPEMMSRRGYKEADIRGIMHGNWLRFFQRAWS
ncbi:MAG: peptidase [Chloroflexi bacterium]|nr:peptidase [Chloroflexota bacterium]